MSVLRMAIRVVSVLVQKVLMVWRWFFFNLRAFIWHQPAPLSTRFYGAIQFSHLPCRVELGRNCSLGEGLLLAPGNNATITIGDETTLNRGTALVASERITIGRRVAVGEMVSIRDQEHIFVIGQGVRDQGFKVAPVEIGDFTWIGRGAFIGPGTRIGKNCVVGANSVVHGIFPDGVLIAGAPAVIKKHFAPAQNAVSPTVPDHAEGV
jgi:acetyltransferase-like isoleucine patch superfamily enzyme